MTDFTQFEAGMLRDVIEGRERAWGAAVGQALECLAGGGLIAGGRVTPEGRAALAAFDQRRCDAKSADVMCARCQCWKSARAACS